MKAISLKRIFGIAILAVALAAVSAVAPAAQQATQSAPAADKPLATTLPDAQARPDTVPVTTASQAARHDYNLAMQNFEIFLLTEEGLANLRGAITEDPHFALAHAALAYFSGDSREEKREIVLAKQNLRNAAPDEILLIQWFIGTKDGDLIPAISAINDLRAAYPKDGGLGDMYGGWLLNAANYERAQTVLQHVLDRDPNYYPALNDLAYAYAMAGDYSKTTTLMEKYVAALPNQPNPQDSYGELLRMAGDFKGSIEHYRAALAIDPTFTTSQLGIASNYAFMGDEERARTEYLRAIAMTHERNTKLQYRMLWAMTYYRASQPEQARKEYTALLAEARKENLAVSQAECYRTMALFNPEPAAALNDLDAAQSVLAEKHEMPESEREIELATILQTRAYIATRAAQPQVAAKALSELEPFAAKSRNNVVQAAQHSTQGAVLLLEGKYAQAVDQLQEDSRNPLSLQLLADAQSKAGQAPDGAKTLATLAAINDERVETAAVAQPVREALNRSNPKSAQANTP
jgi:predicted Zn-dependent protease